MNELVAVYFVRAEWPAERRQAATDNAQNRLGAQLLDWLRHDGPAALVRWYPVTERPGDVPGLIRCTARVTVEPYQVAD